MLRVYSGKRLEKSINIVQYLDVKVEKINNLYYFFRMNHKCLIIHCGTGCGGAEMSLSEIVTELSADPDYIISVHEDSYIYRVAIDSGMTVYPLILKTVTKRKLIRSFFPSIWNFISISFRILKICNREKVQTIYCNTHKGLVYLPRILFRNIKVVCSCRDNVRTALERWLIKRNCSLAVAVSEHIYTQLPECNKTVLHNAINMVSNREAATNPDDAITGITTREGNIVKIANIGNILRWKNQLDFVKIGVRLKEYGIEARLYLLGSKHDEAYFDELKQYAVDHDLESSVIFLGFVVDIYQAIASMDIIVHTAINEPFGRIILESMQLGKPVIAYNCGGPSEIISDGQTGMLIEPHNTQKAAEKIVRLCRDKEECKRIGENALEYVKTTHKYNSYINSLKEFTRPKNEENPIQWLMH